MKRTPLNPMSDKRRASLAAKGVLYPTSTLAGAANAGAVRVVSTGPDQATVGLVLTRAGYACERCCEPVGSRRGVDFHLHHRRPRAAGGSSRPDTNSTTNLVLLDPSCHTEVERYRAAALREGWLVPQAGDPARVAVLIHRGARWVYLDHAGRYATNPPAVAS